MGCESGLHLAMSGHEVTVVEMGAKLAPDANPRHRPMLMDELGKFLTTLTSTRALAITEEGLKCIDSEGKEFMIEADTILLAAGLRPREEIVDALRCTAPIVEVIGDCVEPGTVRRATFRAFHAALDL